MDTLTSLFLPKSPHQFNVSSFRTQTKTSRYQQNANSCLKPAKKLISSQNKTPDDHDLTLNTTAPPKTKQSLLSTGLKYMDEIISTHIDSPLRPSLDAKHILSRFLEPVNELSPTACEVLQGSLPSCLDGAYIRNGPNPQFTPPGRPYHLIDGDGMLHMIRISRGKATFCSRYIQTYKYVSERETGYPFFPSIFSTFGGLVSSVARVMLTFARVLARQFDPVTHGFGTANANLAVINGRLYALSEADLPYEVKVTADGDIITLGRNDFQSNNELHRMTAHPRTDPNTGETFAYRFNMISPFLTLFRINSNGRKQPDVHIFSVEKLTLIHDLAVTTNYAILPDTQMVVDMAEIMRGKSPLTVDCNKAPRIGIIPRYAQDEHEMVWIDVPGLNAMHLVNAWEEEGGNVIVMVVSKSSTVDQFVEKSDMLHPSLEKVEINLMTKTVQRISLSAKFLEMGVINPAYAAKKNRYVYASVMDTFPKGTGIVKIDLSVSGDDNCDSVVASHLYASGCCGGEAFFVAKEPNNPEADEDDGYLVTYVHDDNVNESMFIVMDAKSTSLDTIAVVKLPQRVPCGFHSLFLSENDLNKLRK